MYCCCYCYWYNCQCCCRCCSCCYCCQRCSRDCYCCCCNYCCRYSPLMHALCKCQLLYVTVAVAASCCITNYPTETVLDCIVTLSVNIQQQQQQCIYTQSTCMQCSPLQHAHAHCTVLQAVGIECRLQPQLRRCRYESIPGRELTRL
jgi:hypothetical protein